MDEPASSRPHMPGYGIVGAGEGSGLLSWSQAVDRLIRSHDYWLATAWPDGRPHVMPVWGVWLDGSLWFSSALGSRKARNLGADPRTVATTDDPRNPVVVEGRAERAADPVDIRAFVEAVNAKYATDYGVDFYDPGVNACFRLRPSWAFALSEDDFAGSPTRWRF